MKDLVGQRIAGKYDVTQRIGGGAVADVYEAVHTRLNQRVAIKVLRKEFTRLPAVTRRFLTEGRAASAVRHPGIVQVFDVDQLDTGELYIVMELLQGDDLAVVLERERQFEPARATGIAIQILDALDAAHRAGVVHRDLKPENVLLWFDAQGREHAKIIDFGVARLEREGPAALRRTAEGTIVGTPYYISPEQARGEQGIDNRTDVYAVGVILFEMLTGELPYTGTSVQGIINRMLEDPFPSVRVLEPSLSEALEAVILRATARRRDDRYASAGAFADALRAAAGLAATAEAPAVPAPRDGLEAPGGERATIPAPAGYEVELAEAVSGEPPPRAAQAPRRALSQQTAEAVALPKVQTVVVLPPRLWLYVLGGAVAAAAVVASLLLFVFRRPVPSAAPAGGAGEAGVADRPAVPPVAVEGAGPVVVGDAASERGPEAVDAGPATSAAKELDADASAPPPPDAGAGPSATVRLLRLPRGAAATLDDAPVDPEFTAPIADTPRRLRIEAPGWKTWVRTIRVTGDLELVVEMERREVAAPSGEGGTGPRPADAGTSRPADVLRPLANPFGDA
ncbi:MAG: serine/threonine protein kinase [Deltaproteobacteria bacterium]|nr:serine/threonine protein kinase [Deltaproteobacteria bacterium]